MSRTTDTGATAGEAVVPCPVCNGPQRGVPVEGHGQVLEGWREVYHGPEGHTLTVRVAGEWATFRGPDICWGCWCEHSEAEWGVEPTGDPFWEPMAPAPR